MARRKGKPGQVIGFKIEHHRQEDDPTWLAERLAEAYSTIGLRQGDADGFTVSARAERTKARQMQDVIFQLKERKRNPPEKVSRMDPLASYNLGDCEAQLALHKKQAGELQKTADGYITATQAAKLEAEKFTRLIAGLRAKKKQGT